MENESNLETKTDVILEYNIFDADKKFKKIRERAIGELEVLYNERTPLADGRTEYFVMVRYQIKRGSSHNEKC